MQVVSFIFLTSVRSGFVASVIISFFMGREDRELEKSRKPVNAGVLLLVFSQVVMVPYRYLNFTGTQELDYGGLVCRRRVVTILYHGNRSESHVSIVSNVLYLCVFVCV